MAFLIKQRLFYQAAGSLMTPQKALIKKSSREWLLCNNFCRNSNQDPTGLSFKSYFLLTIVVFYCYVIICVFSGYWSLFFRFADDLVVLVVMLVLWFVPEEIS